MEKRIVRIGNDISLNVTLAYNSTLDDTVNINSISAYIINTSKLDEIKQSLRSKTKFISRFPVEPYVDAYSSTAYDIKSSGYPTWRAYPQNYVYPGIGLNPDWKYIYGSENEYNLTEYKAEVRYTDDKNVVKISFPAEALLFTGTYKLIIVAKIYEPGYLKNNLRTITIDYDDVFTLVDNSLSDDVNNIVGISVGSNFKSGAARSVTITGDTRLGIDGFGGLYAKVSPIDVADPSVTWDIKTEDREYLVLTAEYDTTCKLKAIGLPDGQDTYVATVYATSKQTDTVRGEYQITIDRNYHGDTYVNEGSYEDDGSSVTLNLTDGLQVNIDLGRASGWYDETE